MLSKIPLVDEWTSCGFFQLQCAQYTDILSASQLIKTFVHKIPSNVIIKRTKMVTMVRLKKYKISLTDGEFKILKSLTCKRKQQQFATDTKVLLIQMGHVEKFLPMDSLLKLYHYWRHHHIHTAMLSHSSISEPFLPKLTESTLQCIVERACKITANLSQCSSNLNTTAADKIIIQIIRRRFIIRYGVSVIMENGPKIKNWWVKYPTYEYLSEICKNLYVTICFNDNRGII